ncbi:MAG: mercuric reductase [Myxococcales bacterium]|nr:mercuric reductase [Myxococcales bacterium]MDH5305908.1 mercuric reductase [Myxococcales bacterium]MDH5566891.1 mercuric reductase [Myxococcales bacterium]
MSELPALHPMDEHNQKLVQNVHPSDWVNPEPSGRYNLVVIGAGSAGLISAALAAGLGAKVALIERHHLGGDCLNVGCVPSKGLIRASRLVAEARRAADVLGLRVAAGAEPDFAAAMQRVRRIRAQISAEDAAARYRDELGVEVHLGNARFTSRDAVEVGGRSLRFRRAIIAAGARPIALPIEGLEAAGFRTNETLFNLTQRPRRLGVIGAGPIGCELAQAFRRLGSEVVMLHADSHILPREDSDAAQLLHAQLEREGVRILGAVKVAKVDARGSEKALRVILPDGGAEEILVDEILLAVGRAPNVEGLGLEVAGVAYDAKRGIRVNDYLQTTQRRIYAAGDICMRWKFTHAADAAAKIAVTNALFLRTQKLSSLVMPWCTYTDPEVAHVGMFARDAQAAGIELDTFHVPLREVNRAVTDGEEAGFVKIHALKGRDRIVGATIVAAHAGEMISEVTLAIANKLGLRAVLKTIHPYPTQAEGIKRAAGLYARQQLTPRVKRWLERWMALRR